MCQGEPVTIGETCQRKIREVIGHLGRNGPWGPLTGGAWLQAHAEVLNGLLFPILDSLLTTACALPEQAGHQEKTEHVMSTAYLVISWDTSWQCYLRWKKKMLSSTKEQHSTFRILLVPFILLLSPFSPNERKASQPPEEQLLIPPLSDKTLARGWTESWPISHSG